MSQVTKAARSQLKSMLRFQRRTRQRCKLYLKLFLECQIYTTYSLYMVVVLHMQIKQSLAASLTIHRAATSTELQKSSSCHHVVKRLSHWDADMNLKKGLTLCCHYGGP